MIKKFFYTIICVFFLRCGQNFTPMQDSHKMILGGRTDKIEHHHLKAVKITFENVWAYKICSASRLDLQSPHDSRLVLLTAAHCLADPLIQTIVLNDNPLCRFSIDELDIHIHPLFDPRYLNQIDQNKTDYQNFDIALLALPRSCPVLDQVIPLPLVHLPDVPPGLDVIQVGYGLIHVLSDADGWSWLMEKGENILKLPKGMLVVKNHYKGPIDGDSGGPLLVHDHNQRSGIIGVLSLSTTSFPLDVKSVSFYTDPSYYKEWIETSLNTTIQSYQLKTRRSFRIRDLHFLPSHIRDIIQTWSEPDYDPLFTELIEDDYQIKRTRDQKKMITESQSISTILDWVFFNDISPKDTYKVCITKIWDGLRGCYHQLPQKLWIDSRDLDLLSEEHIFE